jgi:hypothetical protein
MEDDVSIDEMREAVEHMHGVPARYVETVEVDERFKGEVVWQGAVKVFGLTGHPSGATRAYAWSYRTEGTRRKFKAVLGVPPVRRSPLRVSTNSRGGSAGTEALRGRSLAPAE